MLLSASALLTVPTHRAAAFLHESRWQTFQQTVRFMASSSSEGGEVFRVLALHGSEGNEHEIVERLQPLCEEMAGKGTRAEITAITAPFEKGQGFAWWTMAPGVRSFNADEYVGFEDSSKLVTSTLEQGFDAVFAHSQGAILTSALIGLDRIVNHPTKGYILNGVAWPNPYWMDLFSVKLAVPPRVLFLMGEKDRINPAVSAEQVRECLEKAGCDVTAHQHPGGHPPPTNQKESMALVVDWLLN